MLNVYRQKEDNKAILKVYRCVRCGIIYDESLGWPADGIVAGTPWRLVPEDWRCPECGAIKADFEMIEVDKILWDDVDKRNIAV